MNWRSALVLGGFCCCFLFIGGAEENGFKYDPHGRKDPMIPVVDKNGRVLFQEEYNGKKALALKLQGIIFKRRGKSKAIIEKRLYKVGDKISGFIITEIYPDHVVLTDGKENYELWLNQPGRRGREGIDKK